MLKNEIRIRDKDITFILLKFPEIPIPKHVEMIKKNAQKYTNTIS
jgi:hypothetical protein